MAAGWIEGPATRILGIETTLPQQATHPGVDRREHPGHLRVGRRLERQESQHTLAVRREDALQYERMKVHV
ncbi:MAG TPA: hypothetical protein VMS22_09140 [Candidatus Eisenbacteria bacterium]|nr:hypothetical protein [Candidatus Eisenbacteria bacterium]